MLEFLRRPSYVYVLAVVIIFALLFYIITNVFSVLQLAPVEVLRH